MNQIPQRRLYFAADAPGGAEGQYLCDLHSHTRISPDSRAELADMARAALAAGLRELCVTDHCDLLGSHGEAASGFDWPAAQAQYRAVKAQVGDRLTLRLGLELGSAP